MAEKESKVKWFLDWAHHFNWIGELLISLGLGTAAQAFLARGRNLPWDLRLAIGLSGAGALFWLLTSITKWKARRTNTHDAKIDQTIRRIKVEGARSILLSFFAARAGDLIGQLEALWHHWNNSGQRLIHPLDSRADKVEADLGVIMKLTDERRDFLVLYAHHLSTLKVEFPKFQSPAVAIGYPSACEYQEVLAALRAHQERLEAESAEVWKMY